MRTPKEIRKIRRKYNVDAIGKNMRATLIGMVVYLSISLISIILFLLIKVGYI
jgi:hypothetical protein